MALFLEPFADTKLVLGRAQELRDFVCVLSAVVEDEKNFTLVALSARS